MSEVRSERCEQTVRSIAVTVANYRAQEDSLKRHARRRGRLRRRADEDALLAAQARAQAAVFRIVSLVEAHTSEEIVTRLSAHFPQPRSIVHTESYVASEESATRAWNEMKDRLSRWYGLKFAECRAWPHLLLLTEVRNAIAHGTGELTRKQQRDKKVASWPPQLKKLDVELVGQRLVLGEGAVESARAVCVKFLVWLDSGLAEYDSSSGLEASGGVTRTPLY